MKSILSPRFLSWLNAPILLALASFAPMAQAASVTWGSAQNISGDADVSTTGTLIGAFNLGNTGVSSQTVNGVLFQSFAVPSNSNGATVGNFAINCPDSNSENTGAGSLSAPFSNLSSAYQAVLAAKIGSFSPITLTISGLTPGTLYQFQWWLNNSNPGTLQTTATAGNSVTLSDNVSGLEGGLGQFALGGFTADATTQVFTFSSMGFENLTAFQLRQIPEPGTVGLLALGLGLSLAFIPRRQSR